MTEKKGVPSVFCRRAPGDTVLENGTTPRASGVGSRRRRRRTRAAVDYAARKGSWRTARRPKARGGAVDGAAFVAARRDDSRSRSLARGGVHPALVRMTRRPRRRPGVHDGEPLATTSVPRRGGGHDVVPRAQEIAAARRPSRVNNTTA